jgi:hypothetical protein
VIPSVPRVLVVTIVPRGSYIIYISLVKTMTIEDRRKSSLRDTEITEIPLLVPTLLRLLPGLCMVGHDLAMAIRQMPNGIGLNKIWQLQPAIDG